MLKYLGDAVILYSFHRFMINYLLVIRKQSDHKYMVTVIKNESNPILNQYDYPELSVKIEY
jgi:hypothetical protein